MNIAAQEPEDDVSVIRCGLRLISFSRRQLEHNLAKVGVEGSNPFARSIT